MPTLRANRRLIMRRRVTAGFVAPATSYANTGGTGDRTAVITVTQSSGLLATPIDNLVDGSYVTDGGGSTFFNSGSANTSADQIIFDFGSAKYISEFKWYQVAGNSHGNWDVIGSSNGSTGTTITTVALGGISDNGAGGSPNTYDLSMNGALYRYYILQGASGSKSGSPWISEVEFKIN